MRNKIERVSKVGQELTILLSELVRLRVFASNDCATVARVTVDVTTRTQLHTPQLCSRALRKVGEGE